MTLSNVGVLLKTFNLAFPEVLVLDIGSGELLLIGANTRLRVDWKGLEQLFATEARQADLRRVKITDPAMLASRILMGTQEARPFIRHAAVNTDDNSFIEFAAQDTLYTDTTANNRQGLFAAAVDANLYIDGLRGASDEGAILGRMARWAFRRGDLTRGLIYARKAVSLDLSVENYLVLGDLLYAQRMTADGVAAWMAAVERRSDYTEAKRRLVRHYVAKPAKERPSDFVRWQNDIKLTPPETPAPHDEPIQASPGSDALMH